MADDLKITVKFRHNRLTGKKDIDISYEEDESVPSWKHEQRHKEIVKRLLGKGILSENDGDVKITRLVPKRAAEAPPEDQKLPPQRLTERQ